MRFFTFILFLTVHFSTHAQGWKYRYKYTALHPLPFFEGYNTFMFESTPGNYIAGVSNTFWSTDGCMHVIGLNSQGQIVWDRQYCYPQYSDTYPTSRNFCVSGNSFYYVNSIYDTASIVAATMGALTKFDFNGNIVWQKTYTDTISMLLIAITRSVDGGLLLIGKKPKWENYTDPCILIKTDMDGNELWRRELIDTNLATGLYGVAAIQDSASKKILIACNTSKYGITNPNYFHGHLQLLICDSLGNLLGAKNFFNNRYVEILDLIQTKDKHFVAIGDTLNLGLTYVIDPITGDTVNIYANTKQQATAIKFDITNTNNIIPEWTVYFDSLLYINQFKSLYELPDGNLLLGGSYLNDSIQLVRYTKLRSNDGAVLWNNYYDYYDGLAKEEDGYVYEAPYLYGISPCSDNGWVASNFWYRASPKAFRHKTWLFVKYDENGCDSSLAYCSGVGIKENTANKINLSVYPNPVQEILNVELEMKNEKEIKIYVYDILGKAIKNEKLKIENGAAQINVSDFPKGIYFIKVETDNYPSVQRKFVKE